MKRACLCTCHSHAKAQYEAAKQHGRDADIDDAKRNPMLNVQPVVLTSDVLEAAMACPLCLASHVDALSYRGIWSSDRERVEWIDPPKTDTGEGRED